MYLWEFVFQFGSACLLFWKWIFFWKMCSNHWEKLIKSSNQHSYWPWSHPLLTVHNLIQLCCPQVNCQISYFSTFITIAYQGSWIWYCFVHMLCVLWESTFFLVCWILYWWHIIIIHIFIGAWITYLVYNKLCIPDAWRLGLFQCLSMAPIVVFPFCQVSDSNDYRGSRKERVRDWLWLNGYILDIATLISTAVRIIRRRG